MSTSTAILKKRCFNHADREAAAHCMTCERVFCRECVTEHQNRMICAGCLGESEKDKRDKIAVGTVLTRGLVFVGGLLAAWCFFYYLASILLSLPSDFHN